MLKVTLFDVNSNLCREWDKVFFPYQNVNVICKELDNLEPHDLLVTAGNSYGVMSGGIDYYVNKLCKFKAEPLVKEQIQNYWGKLPVGKFVTVDIDKLTKGQFKVLIYAPTMEVPMKIPAKNIYDCFKTIIESYRDTNFTLACCGLGALTGGIPLNVVAETMKKAYDDGMKKG